MSDNQTPMGDLRHEQTIYKNANGQPSPNQNAGNKTVHRDKVYVVHDPLKIQMIRGSAMLVTALILLLVELIYPPAVIFACVGLVIVGAGNILKYIQDTDGQP